MGGLRSRETVQDWLYLIIVSALGLYLVIGLIAWVWMIVTGVTTPDAFTTILAAIAGALAGIVSPVRGPTRDRGGAGG